MLEVRRSTARALERLAGETAEAMRGVDIRERDAERNGEDSASECP